MSEYCPDQESTRMLIEAIDSMKRKDYQPKTMPFQIWWTDGITQQHLVSFEDKEDCERQLIVLRLFNTKALEEQFDFWIEELKTDK